MGSPIPITELGRRALAALWLGLLCLPVSAGAHEVQRTAVRELVRLQGYLDGAETADERIELEVNGRARSFRIIDRQIFIAVGAAGIPTQTEPSRVVVHGERALLARLSGATPKQRVTLLGERRPGSAELFVAAVDLCPESAGP